MKKLITICLVCVLLTAVVQADDKLIDPVNVIQVDNPGYPVPQLVVCHWLELPTEGNTTSWIVHADANILDLHFGTWDNIYYLTAGQTPFDSNSFTCTLEGLGGPTGGYIPDPPPEPQKDWQTLDLWDGIMPYCTYWQISIIPARVPELDGIKQNLWVHPTPEPATVGLLGLGALSLLRRKR
jgi:hypothetical protein